MLTTTTSCTPPEDLLHTLPDPVLGTWVRAYRNLLDKRHVLYSLQGRRGRVVARVECVTLREATFVVRKGGRQRALRDKERNVHAFACGTVCEHAPAGEWQRIRYDLWQHGAFVLDSGTVVTRAAWVRLDATGAWALEPEAT